MRDEQTRINADQLASTACVYVRQSSPGQIRNNLESRYLQGLLKKPVSEAGGTAVQVAAEREPDRRARAR